MEGNCMGAGPFAGLGWHAAFTGNGIAGNDWFVWQWGGAIQPRRLIERATYSILCYLSTVPQIAQPFRANGFYFTTSVGSLLSDIFLLKGGIKSAERQNHAARVGF